MKVLICSVFILTGWVNQSWLPEHTQDPTIIGVWQRQPGQTVTFTATAEYGHQYDYRDESGIHVWGTYEQGEKRIIFNDSGGNACPEKGEYNFSIQNDTLKVSPVADNCEGRKFSISGVWIRKNK